MGKEKGEQKEYRLKSINRDQLLLHPIDVEKLVAPDHPVRAIWELIGRLDLSGFYQEILAVEGAPGRSAWDPRLMISLWIYAYSDGVSSAREISRLCEQDPAYQWLSGMEPINYHSLSDYRVAYHDALQEVFTQVLAVLSLEGLITLQRVMQDGTKIKAKASSDTFRREDRIREHFKLAQEQVKRMEEAGEEEVSEKVMQAKKRGAREKQERLELALVELEKIRANKKTEKEKQAARVSMTDPEARMMKQSNGGYAPSYNVQISTDAKQKVIVGVHLSQRVNDLEELENGIQKVQENLGRIPKQVVVDGGYISRENILQAQNKIDLIGPILVERSTRTAGQFGSRGMDPRFRVEAFKYHEVSNTYTCPAGKILEYERKDHRIGRMRFRYRAQAEDCQKCPFKPNCCPEYTTHGRSIIRGEEHKAITAFRIKMNSSEAKAIYKQRGEVAEFPNAWIKEKIGLRQFHLRGLIKVKMEVLWACLAYNIAQWTRISWKASLGKSASPVAG